MPIGKNSIKRVVNNGYSAVKTEAPDMENSAPITAEKKATAPKKAAAKKPSAKPTAAKKKTVPTPAAKKVSDTKKTATKKPTPKAVAVIARPDGFSKFSLGDDLPTHLL